MSAEWWQVAIAMVGLLLTLSAVVGVLFVMRFQTGQNTKSASAQWGQINDHESRLTKLETAEEHRREFHAEQLRHIDEQFADLKAQIKDMKEMVIAAVSASKPDFGGHAHPRGGRDG